MNDQFDKKIKETLEGYELPYDAAAWNQLNGKMNRTSLLKKGMVAASLLSILIIGSVYLLKSNSTKILLKPTQDSKASQSITSTNNTTSKSNAVYSTKKATNATVSTQTIVEKTTTNENKLEAFLQTELLPALIDNPISIIAQQENNQLNVTPTFQAATIEPNIMIPSKVCFGDEIHFNYLSDNDFWKY
jgi:hypothetical protein